MRREALFTKTQEQQDTTLHDTIHRSLPDRPYDGPPLGQYVQGMLMPNPHNVWEIEQMLRNKSEGLVTWLFVLSAKWAPWYLDWEVELTVQHYYRGVLMGNETKTCMASMLSWDPANPLESNGGNPLQPIQTNAIL